MRGRYHPLEALAGKHAQALTREHTMQVQVNVDHNVEGGADLIAHVSNAIEQALSNVIEQVTRVEVHLSDDNGPKAAQFDKRCMLEVRLKGRKPMAVTEHAASVETAVDGAAAKLIRLIERTLGRAGHENRAEQRVG
jgi:ribosome-associated translation inhibitor RaiA